jgi:flagellar biosynthesis GTPase FlhF
VKCFLVEIEGKGEKQIKLVTAKTPAEARKTIRIEYGAEYQIISVREDKKK